jgi:hypothetical protein
MEYHPGIALGRRKKTKNPVLKTLIPMHADIGWIDAYRCTAGVSTHGLREKAGESGLRTNQYRESG